jgi:hypothetical protein
MWCAAGKTTFFHIYLLIFLSFFAFFYHRTQFILVFFRLFALPFITHRQTFLGAHIIIIIIIREEVGQKYTYRKQNMYNRISDD